MEARPDVTSKFAVPPQPPSQRGALVLALALFAIGAGALGAVLSGAFDRSPGLAPATSAALAREAAPGALAPTGAPAPKRAAAQATAGTHGAAIVAAPDATQQAADLDRFRHQVTTHVPAAWEARFYPLYATAARTFGLNWLLIASIHKQETAFSTAPSTYHGLNFAGCCGGPMQFNVRNAPVTTWSLVRSAYVYAHRPAGYDHPTASHPSIYDDFDSIMAAGWLLYSDGAATTLDDSAWQAAYDYYGHDTTGVTYADQVLARAIGWSQHGFCINCTLDANLVDAVHGAYGAPVLAALTARPRAHAKKARPRGRAASVR